MQPKEIAMMQYFRLTMSNRMFMGNYEEPNKLRAVSKADYAKLKTIILSAATIVDLGAGKYYLSTSEGNGSFTAQCKHGYVYVENLVWKEKAWN